MKRYKPKKYKKQQQEEKQSFVKLREIIRRYSVEQWLHLIRTIDMKDIASLENHQYKGEFLVLVADAALRLAKPNMKSDYPVPNSNDLKNVISLYFSYDKSPVRLIKKLGMSALPLIAYWQNKFNYPPVNTLGRMHLLYRDYDREIFEMTGLTVLDLHIIILAIYMVYSSKEFIYFKADAIASHKVGSLRRENIERFLRFFAIDIEGYRREAKLRHVYDNQVGKFNLLNRYPIIKIDQDRYIVPSKAQMLDSVAANLYFHILEFKQKSGKKVSKTFLDSFEGTLEKYVVGLAKNVFGEPNVISADEIVTDSRDDRCEVVCKYNGNSLAIEAKKLHFQRDAISNADIHHIQDSYDRHLRKGFKQLISTLEYVEKNKYGLIVIPDTMLSPSAILDYIKQDNPIFNTEVENRILICTLSEYEQLMANNGDTVFAALNMALGRTSGEGNAISLILEDMKKAGYPISLVNPWLGKVFEEKLENVSSASGYLEKVYDIF